MRVAASAYDLTRTYLLQRRERKGKETERAPAPPTHTSHPYTLAHHAIPCLNFFLQEEGERTITASAQAETDTE